MPKKSSKKGSKGRTPAAETTLVPHRAPNLTDLLERAKGGRLSNVQQYLSAGGSANVLVEAQIQRAIEAPMLRSVGVLMGGPFEALLLTSVAAYGHNDAAASIELLLEAGAAVDAISNSVGIRDRTALMVACSLDDNLHAVHSLLQGGADPCHQASGGITALHLTASAGFTEICRALHSANSGVLELRGDGDSLSATPLIAASSLDQYAVVKLLCALGADVNQGDVNGNTPLIVAAAEGENTAVLRFLLQQASILLNHRNDNGDTAHLKPAETGNAAAVKLLLQHGADACITNNNGFSAVFAAVAGGHLHVLQLLMQHGAALTATRHGGFTLLMQAATSNQPRVAEFLIKQSLSAHAVTDTGSTAHYYAALTAVSGTETMRLFLAHGADVNACRSYGSTPLQSAASSGNVDTLRALLAAGADVLSSGEAGGTALHDAIEYECFPVVKLLLEHGADAVLNSMQYDKWLHCGLVSALMVCKDTAILKLLLAAGGDVHAVTSSGDTCLHIAARHNYSAPVVCLLIKAGADMHAVNDVGTTAAEVAHDSGNTLIEQLLNRAVQQASTS
jgi:uncharacterized protein